MTSAGTSDVLRLSWSRLKEHEECGARAWLRSQGKRSPVADVRVFFPGTVVDRCMRDWLNAATQEPGFMVAKVAEIMDREERLAKEDGDGVVRWRNADDREKVRVWCTELVTRLEPILFEHVVPFDYQPAIRFEVPITLPHNGIPRMVILVGEMDLLVRPPDGLRVWDLKGTENEDYWRSTYPQLIFYEIAAWLMRKEWPVESGLIQPMCQQPMLSFKFTEEHRQEMLTRIVRCAEDWWAGKHDPKASNVGCDRCPCKAACPKFAGHGRGRVPLSNSNRGPH